MGQTVEVYGTYLPRTLSQWYIWDDRKDGEAFYYYHTKKIKGADLVVKQITKSVTKLGQLVITIICVTCRWITLQHDVRKIDISHK